MPDVALTAAPHRRLIDRANREHPDLVIDESPLARSQYAHDASNYRVAPIGVAFPRDADEVAYLVRLAGEIGVPVTARGAGTSMAGNAVGPGLVLDLRRHMSRSVTIDPGGRTAEVEAGVVLDDLQRQLLPYGLMFGPDPSSHSRATIGGMIGNDACGNHSVAYGRTSTHVRRLDVVLADGTRAIASRGGLTAVHAHDAKRVAELETALRRLAGANLAPLRVHLDRIPRQVSGYQLHHLLPENGFDVARSLVASEGTVAVVVAATVELVPLPKARHLVVIGYDNLIDAAEDVPEILTLEPEAIEAMDTSIVETMRARRGPSSVGDLPAGAAWLYVEFADTESEGPPAELERRMIAAGRAREVRRIVDPAERAALWRVREDGAGLAANLLDGDRSWPGWEDAAVAPADLAGYLREFTALLGEHGLQGVLYGHFGAGCVHVRINFDTASEAGRARMRLFLSEAARLVSRHGGTLSGEHGDGRARSELLPLMYRPEVIAAFAQFKRLMDPRGILNPGIIVDPDRVDAHIPDAPPALTTPFALPHDGGDLAHAAGRCVGIGRCVAPAGGVMCPSYRATGDEQHSTRGRARALQDFASGTTALTSSDLLETLDLCLSCKACSTDCPTGTDVATYKSAVLHQHYRRRLRPLSHYTMGWLPLIGRLTGAVAAPVNALLATRALRALMPYIAGVTSHRALPAFASSRRRRAMSGITSEHPRAILFIDSFTRAFRPELASAAARVLTDAGIEVVPAPDACCGLTWISTGQLDVARTVLRRTAKKLATGEHRELPVIVLEPSCAAALASDLPELVDHPDARALAERITTFDRALHELAGPGWQYPALPANGVLQTHCHEYATFPEHRQGSSLRSHGMTGLDEATGCCGLAGNFGFETRHYDTSIAVADLALTPALDRADAATVVLADGFGCRDQIEHLDPERKPVHLAELLDELISKRR